MFSYIRLQERTRKCEEEGDKQIKLAVYYLGYGEHAEIQTVTDPVRRTQDLGSYGPHIGITLSNKPSSSSLSLKSFKQIGAIHVYGACLLGTTRCHAREHAT